MRRFLMHVLIWLYFIGHHTIHGIITQRRMFIIAQGEAECSNGYSRVSNHSRYSIVTCEIKQLALKLKNKEALCLISNSRKRLLHI